MVVVNSRRCGIILGQLFTTVVAVAAVGWTITVIPKLWSDTTYSEITKHIIAGETFKREVMEGLEEDLDNSQGFPSRSSTLRNAAIIRLLSAENAVATGNRQAIDNGLNTLRQAVEDALTNAPSDAFQWLVLFWLENNRNGFKREHLRFLQMSYLIGPYEGWIAIRRNRLATVIFSSLPMDLAQSAISEFTGLVRSSLYAEAADILVHAGWSIRDLLMADLKKLKEPDRREFAKFLNSKGQYNIYVPGIASPEPRPWH